MVWSGLESFAVEEVYSCLYCSTGEIIVFTRYKIGLRQTHRANAIGPLMFVLKRFDWISFILPKIFVNKKKMSPHLRYSSKFALTHTCTCMSIVTLHLLNFLSFLTSPIIYYLCKLFQGLCYIFLTMLVSSLFHCKCINPIVVSSFSLVTNSIDNCDKKTFWNTWFVPMVVIWVRI